MRRGRASWARSTLPEPPGLAAAGPRPENQAPDALIRRSGEVTLGLKLTLWYAEIDRAIARLVGRVLGRAGEDETTDTGGTTEGAATLEKRVKDTAASSCKEIKVDVPVEGWTIDRCVREATTDAMVQVNKAIADAKAAKK